MIASTLRQRLHPGAACAVIIALTPIAGAAHAADTSPWDADARAGVRLIAGNRQAGDAGLRAGIEMRLAPGWKTYWRYPGDSGVPPRFDFASSQNVKSIAIEWPAPHRHLDESGTTLVYTDDVVFPLRVVPQDPGKPVRLSLVAGYAVCDKLCVPADGHAELVLEGAPSAFDAALTAAEAQVPKPATLGDAGPLAVRAVRREAGGDHPRVIVDVAGTDPVDLFAEGPSPDWALPVPEAIPGAPAGLHRFAFVVDGVPPGAKVDGALLTFTLTSGSGAVEVKAHLD